MEGSEVRTVREANHWSRGELAAKAGLSIGRLAAIELGHGKPPTPHEVVALAGACLGVTPEGQETLHDLATIAVDSNGTAEKHTRRTTEAGRSAAAEIAANRKVDLEEWCGLKSGDKIRAVGKDKQTFVFKRYVEAHNGSKHVEAWGGPKGHVRFHALMPEKVMNMKGFLVMELAAGNAVQVEEETM